MRLISHTVDRIISGMNVRGIKRGQLADAVGLGPSWVTKLLKGDFQTLRDEHRFAIERLLGIDLEEGSELITDRSFSPDAHRIAELVEKSPEAAEWSRLLLRTFGTPEVRAPSVFPALTEEETQMVGRVLIEAVMRTADPLVIGEKVLSSVETLMTAIMEDPRPPAFILKKSSWLEHRGGVSAGAYPEPLRSRQWKMDPSLAYESDYYLLRAFGKAMEPIITDRSDILLRPFRGGYKELEAGVFLIRSKHGRRLAQYYIHHGETEEAPENDGLIDMFRSCHVDCKTFPESPIPDEKMTDLYEIEAQFVQVIE